MIKFLLSGCVLFCGLSPYINSSDKSGSLELVISLGVWGTTLLIAGFFLAISFYCKALQSCLTMISPQNRKAAPKSVWLMFILPYNFIEDFFIMINISNSLEEEAKYNTNLTGIKDFGLITGISWCIAQILSFIPNIAGEIAGALGLVLWIIHWRFIIKINKLLSAS